LRQEPPTTCIRPPAALDEAEFSALWEFGGFPEPFLRRDSRFSARWRRLRIEQLAKEDIRELTRIQEFGQIEVLARNLLERSGSQLVFTNLANDVRVSVDTVRRWVETLSTLHLGFLLRPWFKSLAKSLRKEPKWFLRDWSGVEDEGARAETFVACHLLKAVEGWQDLGLGAFELRYLRDKEKREVDFLVVRDRKPWFLVEVKKSDTHLSQALGNFQKQIGAPHAFQAVMDLDHVDADCFKTREPVVVPARTLLSQIL
jgi:predicted AAA+ superfamily ATPase